MNSVTYDVNTRTFLLPNGREYQLTNLVLEGQKIALSQKNQLTKSQVAAVLSLLNPIFAAQQGNAESKKALAEADAAVTISFDRRVLTKGSAGETHDYVVNITQRVNKKAQSIFKGDFASNILDAGYEHVLRDFKIPKKPASPKNSSSAKRASHRPSLTPEQVHKARAEASKKATLEEVD